MSKASSLADTRAESWIERWEHWIAVLASALLHLLFLFLMICLPVNVAPRNAPRRQQGGVDFIGARRRNPATKPAKPAARTRHEPPAKSRVQSTRVTQATTAAAQAERLTTRCRNRCRDAATIRAARPGRPMRPAVNATGDGTSGTATGSSGKLARKMRGGPEALPTTRPQNDASPPTQPGRGGLSVYTTCSAKTAAPWRAKGHTELFFPPPPGPGGTWSVRGNAMGASRPLWC